MACGSLPAEVGTKINMIEYEGRWPQSCRKMGLLGPPFPKILSPPPGPKEMCSFCTSGWPCPLSIITVHCTRLLPDLTSSVSCEENSMDKLAAIGLLASSVQ